MRATVQPSGKSSRRPRSTTWDSNPTSSCASSVLSPARARTSTLNQQRTKWVAFGIVFLLSPAHPSSNDIQSKRQHPPTHPSSLAAYKVNSILHCHFVISNPKPPTPHAPSHMHTHILHTHCIHIVHPHYLFRGAVSFSSKELDVMKKKSKKALSKLEFTKCWVNFITQPDAQFANFDNGCVQFSIWPSKAFYMYQSSIESSKQPNKKWS